MQIPPDVGARVVERLYASALELEWDRLTPQQRSEQYARWLDQPDIGGRLQEYLSEGKARLWIKDGPMNEWSRALSGAGRWAHLIPGAADVRSRLVRKALGEDWSVVSESLRIKPLRVVARRDEEEAFVVWGPAGHVKHLIWAAISASADGDSRPWIVCITETLTNPTPANTKLRHQRLAERCGLTIRHVEL